ncbi:MAG: polyphenol oxidase family protein [Muribaculaceae bacterium]|nr:polyphenol oxidase family protein [Muribaculaceae bacterium]
MEMYLERIEFRNKGVEVGVAGDDRALPEVVRPVQTHSCNVAVIDFDGHMPDMQKTDAIICRCPGMSIGVRTADCVPLVIYAPDIQAVAAIHAGWRGSLGGIVTYTLERLKQMGADLTKAEAAFGPSICGKCYEVSDELANDFINADFHPDTSACGGDGPKGFGDCLVSARHIDLEAVNTKRLISAGLLPENIRHKSCCTLQTPSLPSWRREPTEARLLTWIRLSQPHDWERPEA